MSLLARIFLFFMIRHPLRSTLFPYTTLFRSAWRAASVGPDDQILFDANTTELGKPVGKDSSTKDRKSTRLNSSHRCISYAVFCLKKKKTGNREDVDITPRREKLRSLDGRVNV